MSHQVILEQLREILREEISPLRESVSRITERVEGLVGRTGRLPQIESFVGRTGRLAQRIESIGPLPIPNGRPRTYLSVKRYGTTVGSVREKYGYQG